MNSFLPFCIKLIRGSPARRPADVFDELFDTRLRRAAAYLGLAPKQFLAWAAHRAIRDMEDLMFADPAPRGEGGRARGPAGRPRLELIGPETKL